MKDADPGPFGKKMDDGVRRWVEWVAENAEVGPETYQTEESRSPEEVEAERTVSERILRYREEMAAQQAKPVKEYHTSLKEAEIREEAERVAEEERAASDAVAAIKKYVAWPPKKGEWDDTPKRPVPGKSPMCMVYCVYDISPLAPEGVAMLHAGSGYCMQANTCGGSTVDGRRDELRVVGLVPGYDFSLTMQILELLIRCTAAVL